MPYFIYRMFPFRRFERVEVLPAFAAASARAKALRADAGRPADCTIKVVFAETEQDAANLLTQVREPTPGLVGDE